MKTTHRTVLLPPKCPSSSEITDLGAGLMAEFGYDSSVIAKIVHRWSASADTKDITPVFAGSETECQQRADSLRGAIPGEIEVIAGGAFALIGDDKEKAELVIKFPAHTGFRQKDFDGCNLVPCILFSMLFFYPRDLLWKVIEDVDQTGEAVVYFGSKKYAEWCAVQTRHYGMETVVRQIL
jgi:hypothetical protein